MAASGALAQRLGFGLARSGAREARTGLETLALRSHHNLSQAPQSAAAQARPTNNKSNCTLSSPPAPLPFAHTCRPNRTPLVGHGNASLRLAATSSAAFRPSLRTRQFSQLWPARSGLRTFAAKRAFSTTERVAEQPTRDAAVKQSSTIPPPTKAEIVVKEAASGSGEVQAQPPQDVVPNAAAAAATAAAATGFSPSAKASRAAHVNLSARLSKEGGSKSGSASNRLGMGELVRLALIARPEARPLLLGSGLLIVSSMVMMSIPWSVGRILDMAGRGLDANEVFAKVPFLHISSPEYFFALLACIVSVGACANFGRIALLRVVGERVVARLRSTLYRRTVGQDAEFFDANRVGDLLSRLSLDAVVVGKSITQNLSDGMRSIVGGVFAFAMMAALSPKLTAILLVVSPAVAVGAFVYGRATRNISRRLQKAVGSLNKIAEERLGNVKTSQMFVGEALEVRRYNGQVRKIFGIGRRIAFLDSTFFASTGWVGNMTVLAILAVGGNLVRAGAMSVGDLTSFMMYTMFAGSSLFGLSGFYTELMKGVGAASRLFELQDRHPSIVATEGNKVPSAQGNIEFRNVRFSYPTRPGVPIFTDLSFTIPGGGNACIVGPSGGGKSTVPSLLLRFYQPRGGVITINGVDISTMNAKSLRRRIGMVAQEPVLFSGTIAENIAYGRPLATRAQVVEAARLANCHFISDFPDGLETQVGARGAQLSGGQKQRIAIARALLKEPDILILDEATSALDAESETAITASLLPLMAGKTTTLSIAHRMSTIKRSDTIVVLSAEGTVAEVGSFRELSSDPKSAFTKLMEWQMTGEGVVPGVAPAPAPPLPQTLMEKMEHSEEEEVARPNQREEIEEDLEEEEFDEDEEEDRRKKALEEQK